MLGLLIPETIASAFTKEKGDMLTMTVRGIKLYFTAFPFMGITVILGGYFQAIEKSKYSTLISLFRGIIFIGILLKVLPLIFGTDGIWLTVPFSELLSLGVIGVMLLLKRNEKIRYRNSLKI